MFRKAMIARRSGIWAAMVGSSRDSRANASPTISNCRSTADRKIRSASKSANVLPAVMVPIASAASCASHSRRFGSRFKNRFPRRVDAGLEIGVPQRAGLHEIDGAAEQRFEAVFQAQIGFERERFGMAAVELDQEIDIAAHRVEIA